MCVCVLAYPLCRPPLDSSPVFRQHLEAMGLTSYSGLCVKGFTPNLRPCLKNDLCLIHPKWGECSRMTFFGAVARTVGDPMHLEFRRQRIRDNST